MKIYELIENNDDDDELFGRSRGIKPLFTDEGLPKLDPDTQRRLMDATTRWLGILPKWSEWRELVDELGEDTAEKIIADFVKFRDYVEQNNIVAAIGSIQRTANQFDWDETFQLHIERDTGIDIWDLMDLSDPNVEAAYSFYADHRRLRENDESDKDLFAYRNPKAVRVDGRAVDMRSIRIGDIMQSDYPDFVDAYVDAATFRDGTRLSNEEMDQLKDVLVDQGMWETMIVDQITSMYESDESDEELFGAEASRKFAICSSDGEILKELENVTVQQAMEIARKMSARFSDDYDDLLLIRSDLNGEYDDSQEIPFSKEIDENTEPDDELFGAGNLKQRLTDRIFKSQDKLNDSNFNWRSLSKDSMLHKIFFVDDYFMDEVVEKVSIQDLRKILGELEDLLISKSLVEAELAEPEEEPKPTQTKQKPKLDPNMFAPKADQPLAKTDPLDDIKKNAGTDKPKVDIKKASQSDTLKATGKIAPTDDMRDMLSRMRDIDIDSDLEGYPEPEPPETLPSVDVNTKNLPAVAGQALLAAGVQNPDFHQVANLPGNMADMIRQLGKSLFGALTVTPTKRIHVVANLGGQGPNTNQEVQAVAGFLKEHGEDLGPGDIDFDNVMPGYSAQTHMFNAAGIRWMLVKDFAGAYIYCWPEEDSLDASPKLSNNTDTKQLR